MVSDEDLLEASLQLGADEGIFAAPEGGACGALSLHNGFPKETIVSSSTPAPA